MAMEADAQMGGQSAAKPVSRKEAKPAHVDVRVCKEQDKVQQSALQMNQLLDEHSNAWASREFWYNQDTAKAAMLAAQGLYDEIRKERPQSGVSQPRPVRRDAKAADMDVDEDAYCEFNGKICWVGQRSTKWRCRGGY